uniref:Uncharacterized protein n=1 Tax=Oryza punctata TaxID=4537 RepID=A0A0E0JHJ9_ORYPU
MAKYGETTKSCGVRISLMKSMANVTLVWAWGPGYQAYYIRTQIQPNTAEVHLNNSNPAIVLSASATTIGININISSNSESPAALLQGDY